MIPWTIVNIVAAIAWLFRRETYVQATIGKAGADHIHFMTRRRGAPRPRRLAPFRGGSLTPA